MDKLTLSLSIEQINGVLAALAKLPFEAVADLISDIRQQAQSQIEQKAPPADAE